MSSSVLDTSALLALLNGEAGQDRVLQALAESATISAVNVAEVVTKLAERGITEARIRAALGMFSFGVAVFEEDLAYQTGLLRPLTRHLGLSLGDRACLALAQMLGLPVLTADRSWSTLQLGITIHLIR